MGVLTKTLVARAKARSKDRTDAEKADALKRARLLSGDKAFLRVIMGDGPRRYDMGPDGDPDRLLPNA